MSLKSAIENAKARVSASFDAVVAKGGTRPSVANLAALPSAIESIPSGGGIVLPNGLKFGYSGIADFSWLGLCDTSLITDGFRMFESSNIHDATMLKNYLHFENFTTLQNFLFSTANIQKSVDFSNCNFSKVTTFQSMLQNSAVEKIDFRNCIFGTGRKNIFAQGSSLVEIDFTGSDFNLDVSSFYNCTKLKNILFGEMPLTYIMNIGSAFHGCSSLEYIDLSICPYQSQNYANIFGGCTSLKRIDIRNWEWSRCNTSTSTLFTGCINLFSMIGEKTEQDVIAENITIFDGLIQNMQIAPAPINYASALALANGVGVPSSQKTITFDANSYNAFTDEQKATISNILLTKGFNIATI